jgi:hypothetical protein
MKRVLLLLSAPLVAIALGAAASARAESCTSNIVDGSAAYGQVAPTTLSGTIQTGLDELTPAPTCKSVSYNAIISFTLHGRHVIRVEAHKGDGINPFVRFTFNRVTSEKSVFCVALSSTKGVTILDTAPSTASRTEAPVPVADPSSPIGFSCGSWVAVTALGSSGGGASGFAG